MIRKRRRNTRQGGQGGPLSRARGLCDKQPARQSYGDRVLQTETGQHEGPDAGTPGCVGRLARRPQDPGFCNSRVQGVSWVHAREKQGDSHRPSDSPNSLSERASSCPSQLTPTCPVGSQLKVI